ncbi:hypothetical protein AKJ51_02600 [candidate division MSBL1 archaeon SCGC-AAA382A20]|uniref:4Fe-4S ferredoxin-type domain-containing protein n=1 Tax=candidate division MSBL1 archaeon SCGC-AAA382A20 TaxID=1698280 RepID=A0A133VKD5_9EURY|nr:hypothetical protein AKJ51_02600 [candidate division MSBL1 archaeon SCGC-AAA382A20]
MPKVEINQDYCSGSGNCMAVCSEVFEVVNGLSQIVEEYRGDDITEGTVPEDMECVYKAEKSCPFGSITVE